jgi:uncharacterized protein (TIGR03067 family)
MRRGMLVVTVLGFAVAVAGAEAAQKDGAEATNKELARLQGTWKVVEAVAGGKKLTDDFSKDELVISGKEWKVRGEGRETYTRTFRLDPASTPRVIDWTEEADGAFKDRDKIREGVYEIDGETLKVCFHADPEDASGEPKIRDRPTEVKSKEGSSTVVIVFRRAKP